MSEVDPPVPNAAPAGKTARGAGLALVAFKNAASAVVTRISSLLVSIMLTPIVLHALGETLYGVVQVVSSIYEYMSLLRGGLSAALRRYVTLFHHADRHEDARVYYAVGFWWSGVLRSITLIASSGDACFVSSRGASGRFGLGFCPAGSSWA